jgi:hypothetical protein
VRFRRTRVSLPAEVRAALPLTARESVLAAAVDDHGGWYAGTARALLVPVAGGWTRVPWETVERAGWDRDSERLLVVETADFGRPQPTHQATLAEPERLLELIRERVTASVVVKVFEPVEGKRGITVSGRRAPHTDDDLTWSVLVDPGLDERSDAVQAAADRALAAARREIGLDPGSDTAL